MCVFVVYPVLVGETPDPGSHFHSEDEEQEEEELNKETRVRFLSIFSAAAELVYSHLEPQLC